MQRSEPAIITFAGEQLKAAEIAVLAVTRRYCDYEFDDSSIKPPSEIVQRVATLRDGRVLGEDSE